ncbi:MAG: hypothetical protein HYV08_10175 [Deltaproteobacteria bacterium]|nr:hypothetical protein [Deltaproteobacteria bacterium]MBI3076587.1 hypothetical protein [Deltaproteobacteria bacterium]
MSEKAEFASSDHVTFVKDYQATSIPSGTAITVKAGTAGVITQALGTNYTVHIGSALIRVPKRDGEVLARS